MSSIFSRIIKGEIPSYKIAEDDWSFAFLDINPLKEGHTLIVPKKEVDQLFELSEEDYQALWSSAYKIAKAIKKAVPCKRIGVAVIGLEVPHAHIHLIPLNEMGDMDFSNQKLKLSKERFEELASAIRSQLNN